MDHYPNILYKFLTERKKSSKKQFLNAKFLKIC